MPFIKRSKWETLIKKPFTFKSAWRMFDDKIKYCPECMHSDAIKYGICYPHREHQFRYINICAIHECSLITSCNLCSKDYSLKGDLPLNLALVPRCSSGHMVPRNGLHPGELDPFEIWMVESLRLMIDHYTEIDAEKLIEKFIPILAKSGYIGIKGAILKRKVIEDMIAFFGTKLLHKYGLNEKILLEQTVIVKLFTPNNLHTNIYLYLFLVKFLIGDFKKLILCDLEYSTRLPFDKGPWLCKNRICPSYNLPVITGCIRIVKKRISGQFTCSICGYSYIQRFESFIDNSAKKVLLVDFGFLWRETVTKMLSENMPIVYISKKIGSAKATVKKFKLNILNTNRSLMPKNIEPLKDEFINLMHIGNFTSRCEVRNQFGLQKFNNLMKTEREWMENLLPKKKSSKYRDYRQLDIESYESVKKAYEQLLIENPNRRISKTLILNRTSKLLYSRIRNKVDCFSKTNQLLEGLIEQRDSYLKRVFPVVLKRFENSPQNKTLTWPLIINQLHHGYLNASPEIKEWVLQKIEEYQSDKNKL
ncbi:TniQ family protein [Paenibacillus sp. CGMCC 1.16610]|uniref:Transposon Tn7 transposition protein TnsD C-termianl domain-containing protein n=2 Tax=Paenibacillus TaxID=44249 RepID=A0ABW9U1I9_9BACL|nr:TniQ family protein [Paenibacillus sp. CGMCC 1.16610]MVQ33386.1 hypothetical protein [Paenibacillus anseongense]